MAYYITFQVIVKLNRNMIFPKYIFFLNPLLSVLHALDNLFGLQFSYIRNSCICIFALLYEIRFLFFFAHPYFGNFILFSIPHFYYSYPIFAMLRPYYKILLITKKITLFFFPILPTHTTAQRQ